MNKSFFVLFLSLLAVGTAFAGQLPEGWKPPTTSKELEQIKALKGTWTGQTNDHDGQSKAVTVTYAVTSGGSAVVETIDPGTPHEMVSVYHDVSGKLAMNHYCMLGNEPELILKNSSDLQIILELSPGSQAVVGKEMHMHSLTLDIGSKELTETWTAAGPDGKTMSPPTVMKLQKTA